MNRPNLLSYRPKPAADKAILPLVITYHPGSPKVRNIVDKHWPVIESSGHSTKVNYSPFHSSLPFEHLGQSNLFTRVCRLFVNQVVFFYSILELKQCPRCQVFLKSIQHLSLCNDVTSSDKNIVIVWLKHIFMSKFFAQHIRCILRTHKHTFVTG